MGWWNRIRGFIASAAHQRDGRALRRQRGFALLAVLWLILALALFGGAFLRQARSHARLAVTQLENARAEALADAGVERAKLALLAVDPATAWRADGRPYALAFDGGTVTVSLQDEAGKIDLNRAGEAVLQGLFEQARRSSTAAQALADAVADFRDADDDRRPDGAEAADYAAAGSRFTAKNAPFAATDELLQVLGMDDALFRQIAPYVTVDSPRRTVNPATASELVLRALPNLESGQVDALLEARRAGDPSALALGITTATIRADAVTAGGGRFIREAIVRRTADPLRPFDVLSWRQRWPEDATGDGQPRPSSRPATRIADAPMTTLWQFLPLLLAILVAPFVGSFLGTLVLRLPAGRSAVIGRSGCDRCGGALAPWDLVPLVSWAVLRGRCRLCGGRIAAFYPGIEAAALALLLWAATAVPPGLLPITGLLGWWLLALALLDWRHLWLPDLLTLPLVLAGLAMIAALDLARLPDHLIGAALGYGVLRLVGMIYRRLRARPGLGEGDAKLMAAAGAWVSWQALPTVLLIATLTALAVVALDAVRTRRLVADKRIPFGSHLAVGLWLVWLYGPIVLDAGPL